MHITLTIEGIEETLQLLDATASRLEQPRGPLLETLATKLQVYLQAHIRNQAGPDGPWPQLAPVTRKIREYYGHPPDAALIRSGDLLQSITLLALDDQAAEVGTLVPFASTLQTGGTVIHPTTGRTRTVQAFPFAYVSAQETEELVATIQEYYFDATA